jgi:hypothetical protein
VSMPAGSIVTRWRASRRSVFMRSLGFTGVGDGATPEKKGAALLGPVPARWTCNHGHIKLLRSGRPAFAIHRIGAPLN